MITLPSGLVVDGPRLITRAAMPNIGSVTYNPTQTDTLLNALPELGTPASSVAPRMGFSHPAPELPVMGRAAVTGNKLRSQSRTGNGVKHEVGFQNTTSKTLTMDFSDAKIKLLNSVRAQWSRSLSAYDIDQLLARVGAESVLNTEEAEFVATCWLAGAWTTSYASGAVPKWNNFASDPVVQINTAKRVIQRQTGKKANHLLIPAEVADALCVHPGIRSYFKGGQGGPVDQALEYADLARVFKLAKVTVAERIQNNGSDLLEASISLDFSITDGALLFVDNGNSKIGGSALCRAHYDAYQAEGVVVDMGENLEDKYTYWNIQRMAGYNVLDAGAGVFFADLL